MEVGFDQPHRYTTRAFAYFCLLKLLLVVPVTSAHQVEVADSSQLRPYTFCDRSYTGRCPMDIPAYLYSRFLARTLVELTDQGVYSSQIVAIPDEQEGCAIFRARKPLR